MTRARLTDASAHRSRRRTKTSLPATLLPATLLPATLLLLTALGCGTAPTPSPSSPPTHLLHDHAAFVSDTLLADTLASGVSISRLSATDSAMDTANAPLVHVVVEIPAGTNEKWQVEKGTGALEWERENDTPRVVQYLGYPGNYGIVPRTLLPRDLGGDGDPLDVLLLGPAQPRGSVVPARVIAMLRLVDRGERDDKIVAVPVSGPLSDARDLATLEARYPGVRQIVETWFTNYKGPGVAVSNGWVSADSALFVVREASRYYEAAPRP
jgi:inorganic pyrophosphatase